MQEKFLTPNCVCKPHAKIYNLMLFKYFSKKPHRGYRRRSRKRYNTCNNFCNASVTMLQV